MGFIPEHRVTPGLPIDLEPGDLVLLATDGAIEVRNENDEMFGRERLERLIDDHRQLPAHDLVHVIRDEITRFHPGDHPPDDITVLLLERKLRSP
jgi:sigma-B regulation protein RsbU (phosphoserine phosphatase)